MGMLTSHYRGTIRGVTRCMRFARVGCSMILTEGTNAQEQIVTLLAISPNEPVHSSNRAVGVHRARATVG
jgi:hypothetical protein